MMKFRRVTAHFDKCLSAEWARKRLEPIRVEFGRLNRIGSQTGYIF
jgi:hypothetical protein